MRAAVLSPGGILQVGGIFCCGCLLAVSAAPTGTSWKAICRRSGKSSSPGTAASLGATWVGGEDETPPVKLDRAITFTPSGKVVISALASLRKGGVVAINAIHLDSIPEFDYDKLLWGERQIRSAAGGSESGAAARFCRDRSVTTRRSSSCGESPASRRGRL